jgi:hypothetical protein
MVQWNVAPAGSAGEFEGVERAPVGGAHLMTYDPEREFRIEQRTLRIEESSPPSCATSNPGKQAIEAARGVAPCSPWWPKLRL